MNKQGKKVVKILDIVKEHIQNNLKQYIIIATLFVLGIVVGVIFVNYSQDTSKEQVDATLTTFIGSVKNQEYQIDYINLLKSVIKNHTIYLILMWFLGCSVIGVPIVYFMLAYKGFSIGYTISSIILALGTERGILFVLFTMFMQNIFIIPAVFGAAGSGVNLYKSIMKNKRIENIKIEIIRHTIFCIIMLLILIIASIIEVYVSSVLIKIFIKFF